MADIPTCEPTKLNAGDTIAWQRIMPDYPASAGWVISYALRKNGSVINITGMANGDIHLVNISAATSATWTAGDYAIQGYVTNGSQRETIFQARIQVNPNLAADNAGLDTRSIARQTLDALNTLLLGRAASGATVSKTTVAGQTFEFTTLESLIAARDRFQAIVNSETTAERLNRGLPSRRNILIQFRNPNGRGLRGDGECLDGGYGNGFV